MLQIAVVVDVRELRAHFHEQDRGCDAERHQVAEAIELGAEVARAAGDAGDLAVDRVENHGEQDQRSAKHEIVGRVVAGDEFSGVGSTILVVGSNSVGQRLFDAGEDDDGEEPANQVAERKERGQNGDGANWFHGCGCAAIVPMRLLPAGDDIGSRRGCCRRRCTVISAAAAGRISSVRDPSLIIPNFSPRVTVCPSCSVQTIRRANMPEICRTAKRVAG